ncbi:hypothetical protein FS749_015497, partial [Ceratobasidium sp. UAMH 11750]
MRECFPDIFQQAAVAMSPKVATTTTNSQPRPKMRPVPLTDVKIDNLPEPKPEHQSDDEAAEAVLLNNILGGRHDDELSPPPDLPVDGLSRAIAVGNVVVAGVVKEAGVAVEVAVEGVAKLATRSKVGTAAEDMEGIEELEEPVDDMAGVQQGKTWSQTARTRQ